MGSNRDRPTGRTMLGRRAALKRLAGAALAVCTAGCSRGMLLGMLYPEAGALAEDDVSASLTAFVDTVVPGVTRPARIAALMQDPGLPFAEFGRPMAADLARRAALLGGSARFEDLTRAQRTALVREAIEGGGVSARICNGAVLFAQAAVYGGLASDDGSCGITGFEGPFRFRGYAEQTYPDPERFLPPPTSSDGNPW